MFGVPGRGVPAERRAEPRARPHLHPARRPRAERVDLHRALAGSSGANPFACIASGIACLWGPAHGGANEAALQMLIDLQKEAASPRSGEFVKKVKDKNSGVKLMGFGHRVYKNYDPRAKLMQETTREVLAAVGAENDPLLPLAMALEKIALEDEYFVSRKLYPNVDFYSGIVQRALGIPTSMFTCIFALARTVGWIAQWNEMISDPEQKIGRRGSSIPGPRNATWCRWPRGNSHVQRHEGIRGDSNLFGSNAPYVEELYERYLADPASVDPTWRATFDAWQKGGGAKDVAHSPVIAAFEQQARNPQAAATTSSASFAEEKNLKILQYIRAHRVMGSRYSQLDPLKRLERTPVPELELSYYGLTDGDMDREFSPGSWQGRAGRHEASRPRGRGEEDLLRHHRHRVHVHLLDRGEALDPEALRGLALHAHLRRREEEVDPRAHHRLGDPRALPAHALRRAEALLGRGRREPDPDARHDHRERRLEQRQGSRDRHGAPRRLNVLVNTLGKIPADLFSEFEGKHSHELSSGDVKYHQGFSSDIKTAAARCTSRSPSTRRTSRS
jgi:hypothetical protein